MPLLSRGLDLLYVLLVMLLTPVVLYRRLRFGKHRRGWREKLTGHLTRRSPARPCVWFHAVSVGEVLQIQSLVNQFAAESPGMEILISTTTETGYDVAVAKFPNCTITWFPLDFSWAVSRAIGRVMPQLIVMVELELWPNFILAADRARVPLMMVNGRMGEKSFRGYQKIRPLVQVLLSKFRLIAVQNEIYAQRLIALGAPAEHVRVTGNLKFDRAETCRDNSKTQELRQDFGLTADELVLIAGSTQDPEERLALQAWQTLREEFPHLRLILVPRHKERFEDVARLVNSFGIPLFRRSQGQWQQNGTKDAVHPVLLLDTLGELSACWGLADVAFVGGSLTQRGGQNMLEPAGYGAAVLFGPNTWNFRREAEALIQIQAAEVVTDGPQLTQAVRHLLSNPQLRRERGETAQRFVLSQQGATARTLDAIHSILNTAPAIKHAA